jgi:signal transduction histidine kinase
MRPPRILREFDCFAVQRGWREVFRLIICAAGLLGQSGVLAEALPDELEPHGPTLTNALQVRHFASRKETSVCFVRLDGVILWFSPAQDQLILQDDSGGVSVKMDLPNQLSAQSGERVVLEGNCLVGQGEVLAGALIDNDGLHSVSERTGTLFLSAGLHPITVKWFNGPGKYALGVDAMGPGMARQQIPDASLFRTEADSAAGAKRLIHGLNYSCYEGQWSRLPSFTGLPVLKQGSVTNFDLQVRSRDTNVGMVFSGYYEAPQSGEYTFWLESDDGGKLYIDEPPLRLTVLGKAVLPAARAIVPGQLASEEQDCQRVEVEGVITRVSKIYGGGASLELASDFGRAYLKVMDGEYGPMGLLLRSRIRATGIYQNVCTVDGQAAASLLMPSFADIELVEMAPGHWLDYPVLPIQSLAETNLSETTGSIVHVSGTVCSNAQQNCLAMEDGTGRVLLETTQPPPQIGDRIEALGWRSRKEGQAVLLGGFYRTISKRGESELAALPLLTKVIQVMSLSRQEAQRPYPVRIQGVITARVGGDSVIQDSTASIYVSWDDMAARERPEVGDYWEIEGESSVGFAPMVRVRRAQYLRHGILPEPLRPAGDELINGSFATKYVEIQGIATGINNDDLTLLTREGDLRVDLFDLEPKDLQSLSGLEGALIRVRGISSPNRDKDQRVLPLLRLLNASVSVDEPAPADPFKTPMKRVADLFLFDARADALRRVTTVGQVVHERNGEYFLMDGANGLRFKPKAPVHLQIGDLVEVVGFPDMSGPSPVLRQAVVRRTGRAELPAPVRLSENGMLNGKLDGTLVSLESRLVSASADSSGQVLELQNGNRGYVAQLANHRGLLSNLLPGSRLELTGVYAGEGGGRMANREVDSFELLLNSPADVRVLERPPWWTIRRALTVVGGLALGILAALVWVALLRRQVETRSRQLAVEVQRREQIERQRALEEERSRIAQDLHDDLGATLTEIRFLSAVESRDALVPQATRLQLSEVSEKSRQLVSSLDEIVWAVNPANDSLPSLGSYLRHIAEEFFRNTPMRCRLDVDQSLPSVPLTSEVRHNLYLAIRESLNNIAKHSQATEAWLRIHWRDQTLHIVVEDNGCGFSRLDVVPAGNGLPNMRRRLEKIGGRFECDTQPGGGTVCRIYLPFT